MLVIKDSLEFNSVVEELGIPQEKLNLQSIELNSQTDSFDILCDVLRGALIRKKYTLECVREILSCVDEAFSNAVVWGNKNDSEKKVNVKYYVCRNLCMIGISDEGEGFDLFNLLSNSGEFSILKRTRGLHFISRYADRLYFNGRGNDLIIVKFNLDSADTNIYNAVPVSNN